MTTFQSIVDSHLIRHYVRETDVLGAALCGLPPVGVRFDDPPPDLNPYAPYLDECDSCRLIYIEESAKHAVAEMYRIGETAVSAGESVRAFSAAVHAFSEDELLKHVMDGTDGQKWEVAPYKDKDGMFRRADHTHRRPPPDPLTSSWEDLLEEDA